jgi:chondroitin AC lyase
VNAYLQLQNNLGGYSDIDYSKTNRTNWQPIEHLNRIKQLVNVYIHKSDFGNESDHVYNSIVQGLQFWYNQNPKSANWWYNQIAAPQEMGLILIGMRAGSKKLPSIIEENVLSQMKTNGSNPKKQTGANKLDIALHWLYRSCLENDYADLKLATNQAFITLQRTNKEGIQWDGSFFQHGQQLYVGGYGQVLINGIVDVAKYLTNTPFALSGVELIVFSNFVRETFLNTIRGENQMYNVLGRGVTRVGALSQVGLIPALTELAKIDSVNKNEYEAAIKRISGQEKSGYEISTLHKHYWRADYTLYQTKDFSFDVRMASKRTSRNENGNEENLNGYFLSDGGNCISVSGNEYAGIFPVWDWTKIPGTTTPALPYIPRPKPSAWMGKSKFAGGVSDGVNGLACFALNNTEFDVDTYAKKSWFFFQREVVCLGAGINSASDFSIHTTLNQCNFKAPVYIGYDNKIEEQQVNTTENSKVDWVWHDNIAYFFPTETEAVISTAIRTGSWNDHNKTQSAESLSKAVFTLWLDHGIKPLNGNYAYIVVPALYDHTLANSYSVSDIEIIENTDMMQAVYHKREDILAIVFYKAGTFSKANCSITANKSCALLIKNISGKNAELTIADPAQSATDIALKVKIPGLNIEQEVVCKPFMFPFAGASRKFKL